MEKLESELAVKSSNVRNLRVDVADPSVLNKLKGELDVCVILFLRGFCVCRDFVFVGILCL